jgi:integrase/recombinase XerC
MKSYYFTDEFAEYCRDEKGLSESTIETYLYYLRIFDKFWTARGVKKPLFNLTQKIIDEYMLDQRDAGMPYNTRNTFRAVMQVYLNFRGNGLEVRVAVKKTRADFIRLGQKRYLTPQSVATIREYINGLTEKTPIAKRLKFRKKLTFEIMIATGMRKGELANLKIEDINIEEKYILVGGQKNMQTRSNNRIWRRVPLLDGHLLQMIIEYKKKGYKKIVDDVAIINKLFIELSEKTGIKVNPHLTRHFFITKILSDGLQPNFVAEIVGDTVMTILHNYYHPTPETIQGKMQDLYGSRFI